MTTPLLIISDSPSCTSGLGRICRELATRIATNLPDIYEVSTLGYGGHGSSHLPFFQHVIEGMHDWFIPTLQDVWNDFAGDREGVIFTIWDASRLLWFARPDNPQWCPDPHMRAWLTNPPFERWGYFPIDAVGPNGKMSVMQGEVMRGFDRILTYTDWAKRITQNSLPDRDDIQAIPHGIDTTVFRPRDQYQSRQVFSQSLGFRGPEIGQDEKIIGIIATNQARKDWALAIEACARLAKDHPIRIYCQIDQLERHWDLAALLMDYGLIPQTLVNTNQVSDEIMSYIYSACDLTLGIGPEGFGYPIFESLACGTPCLAGSYGGQAEFMPREMLIDPIAYRFEGLYNSRRPVHDSEKWAYRIAKMLRTPKTGESLLPARLDWNNLWANEWQPWFESGRIHQLPAPIQFDRGSKRETDTDLSDQSKSTVACQVDPAFERVDPFDDLRDQISSGIVTLPELES